MQGLLRLSRTMRMRLPTDIKFTKDRFTIRANNMMEEDRVKFYNWNLACLVGTSIPLLWMATVNYDSSAETKHIYKVVGANKECRYNAGLF